MDYHIIFVSKIFRSDKYDKTQKNIEKTNYNIFFFTNFFGFYKY